jgi:hypothetical protein
MILAAAALGVFSPRTAFGVMGGGCTSSTLRGCASNYGTLEEGFCSGGAGSHCSNCMEHELSFCAPEDECEVEDCVLDDFRAIEGN